MKILFTILIIVSLSACYYDVEEELYGSCNTTNVSYAQNIKPILINNTCLNCHSNPTNNYAPFSLVTYSDLKAKVDDQRLLGAINHEDGFAHMPQGQPKLSQCDINKIKAWIDAGAPDN